MPVSTTFLLLNAFSTKTSAIIGVLGKSLSGYFLAFFTALIVWLLVSKFVNKYFRGKPHKIWVILQWITSGMLWSVWIQQDAANIAIYLPRSLSAWEFVAFAGYIFIGLGLLFYLKGDKIQGIVDEKSGVTDVRANLLPEHKLEAIRELQTKYGHIAMTGDGVNDAPALATATVGIAMGGAGTAVALETADVALMADDLGKLPFAVGLSRASRAIIRQNLAVSLGVIALLILTSVTGLLQLSGAVILHEGSSILVVLNALRLLGYRQNINK